MNPLKILKNSLMETFNDDCLGMAAEMAFNLLLSLFPFLIFTTAIFGLLGNDHIVEQIIRAVSLVAPASALEVIRGTLSGITETSSGGLLTIGFLGTLWAATNAINVIIKSINRAYNVKDTRGMIKDRALSLFILFLFMAAMFIAANLVVMGSTILYWIDKSLHISNSLIMAILLGRWPVMFLVLFLMALIIYYFVPNLNIKKRIRFITAVPGALFFTITWLLVSWGFSMYVENFGRYNSVYGTLGAVVVLMLWLYYTSLVILLGGEINSEVYRSLEEYKA